MIDKPGLGKTIQAMGKAKAVNEKGSASSTNGNKEDWPLFVELKSSEITATTNNLRTTPVPVAVTEIQDMGEEPLAERREWKKLFSGNTMGSRGMTHNFVPPTITNGAQFIELNKDEVEKELEKWKNALILYVVGHEPTIVAVDRFIANQWNFTAKPKVFYHNDGYFLVRFNSKEDRDESILAVAEFVVAGGDYMGTTVPIGLSLNGSYDNMIASLIEVGVLTSEPNDLVIIYQMNRRGKIHPTFIKNDRHVSLYMLDIGIDGSRPILRIHVNVRPPIEPANSFNDDNDSIGNERLGDHSKESLGVHSNESLGDHSMNIHDDPTNLEIQPVDAEDPECEC
ncbi:hypothetical protein H5410_047097 [Solanum commersonii]|uniref:DUF4283 domain-containing protein n=1 Tax=Solanum commersonii TaxID=4109 RepID=A0A9J5XG94_SOLCO|nr:hypothetical protein H5410_047097 [Solanum commersonii]